MTLARAVRVIQLIRADGETWSWAPPFARLTSSANALELTAWRATWAHGLPLLLVSLPAFAPILLTRAGIGLRAALKDRMLPAEPPPRRANCPPDFLIIQAKARYH